MFTVFERKCFPMGMALFGGVDLLGICNCGVGFEANLHSANC